MKIHDKQYFNLLKKIVISQYKLKDQSTFFGFLWSFMHPLIFLLVLYSIFNFKFGKTVEHYAIYILIGVVQYTFFANSTMTAMKVLSSMKNITSNMIFPKELLVISSVLSNIVEFIVSMIICVLIAFLSGIKLSFSIIMLPFVMLLELILVVWVSLLMSFIYVFVKDIAHIYQVFLRILFFITPIFYTISFLGDGLIRSIAMLNPLAIVIKFSRTIIISGEFFSISGYLLVVLINICLIYFVFKIFKKYEPIFAEKV